MSGASEDRWKAQEYIVGRIEQADETCVLLIRTDSGQQIRARLTSPAGAGPQFEVGSRYRFGLSGDQTVVSFGNPDAIRA